MYKDAQNVKQRKEPPMQWDYKVIGDIYLSEGHRKGHAGQEGGLKKLGAEGWELVAVSVTGEFYLKRPILAEQS